MGVTKQSTWIDGSHGKDHPSVNYHDGEAIDVLLPVLPGQKPGKFIFTGEYFDVDEINDGDLLIWEPVFQTGLLVLGVKLRCPHG